MMQTYIKKKKNSFETRNFIYYYIDIFLWFFEIQILNNFVFFLTLYVYTDSNYIFNCNFYTKVFTDQKKEKKTSILQLIKSIRFPRLIQNLNYGKIYIRNKCVY